MFPGAQAQKIAEAPRRPCRSADYDSDGAVTAVTVASVGLWSSRHPRFGAGH